MLCIFERQILGKTFGLLQTGENTWKIKSKSELDHLINAAYIIFITAQKIRWLGHTQRMHSKSVAKRLLEWKPMGSQKTGRLGVTWLR